MTTEGVLTKPYDFHIHWSAPFFCNLKCEYCFNRRSTWLAKQPEFPAEKVMATLNSTGKIFLFSLCGGGEWFLIKDSLEMLTWILEKHYVIFNTNLTMNTASLVRFLERSNISNIVDIDASLHIKELERLRLIDVFVNNYMLLKERGISITAKACFFPKLAKESSELVDFFQRRGVYFAWDKYVGKFDRKTYPAAYSAEELKMMHDQNSGNFRKIYPAQRRNVLITKQDFRIEHDGSVTDSHGKNVGHILEKVDI